MRSAALLVIVAACAAGHKSVRTTSTSSSVLDGLQSSTASARLNAPISNARVSGLRGDVAVRRRVIPSTSWRDIVAVARSDDGDDNGGSSTATSPPPTAEPIAPPVTPAAPEQLVVELWLAMQVDDVVKSTATIGQRVTAAGGRVVSSNVEGRSSAALVLRVPPGKASELSTWLASLGSLESQRSLATDVSKELFDRDLAVQNLRVTMARLEKLAEHELPLSELLEIEKEMTRVRGEIERLEGEQRFLTDRVQYATINITLSSEAAPLGELAEAHVYPGARLATLILLDPGMGPAAHFGGGATVRVSRLLTFDLDLFPRDAGDSRALLATLGAALYSDFFGYGRRRFMNPFFGARVGYGYVSGQGGFAVGGELGLELYRQPKLTIEMSGRALALARDKDTTAAFEGVFGASVPF